MVFRDLSFWGFIFSVTATGLLSFKFPVIYTFVLYLVANSLLIVWALKKEDRKWVFIQQLFFTLFTLIGLYNYGFSV